MSPRGFEIPTPVGKAIKEFSKSLGTKQLSPDHAAPSIAPSLLTTTVPIDIVEKILLYLPGQDILKVKRVRWGSRGVNVEQGGS